jgi:hypothetical protein
MTLISKSNINKYIELWKRRMDPEDKAMRNLMCDKEGGKWYLLSSF